MLLSLFSVANKERSKRTPGHFEGELVGFAVFAASVPPLILRPSLPTKSKKKNIFQQRTFQKSTESITEGSSQSLAVFYGHSSLVFFLPKLKGEHFASLAPVVRKVDSATQWINYYPKDSAIGFRKTYPLDGDLSGG